MSLKLAGTLEIDTISALDVTTIGMDFNDNVEGINFNSTLGFPTCAKRGRRQRRFTVETNDVVAAGTLEGCDNGTAVFNFDLIGNCGTADVNVALSTNATAHVKNLSVPTVGEDEDYKATFDVIVSTDDGTEPITLS